IVCLTEETVETLYLLGEHDRIVGVSGLCGAVAAGPARENICFFQCLQVSESYLQSARSRNCVIMIGWVQVSTNRSKLPRMTRIGRHQWLGLWSKLTEIFAVVIADYCYPIS